MSTDTLAKYVAKPATAFAVGSVIGSYMRPDLSVAVFGKRIPAWALAGIVCAVGAEASGLLHDTIMSHIPHLSVLEHPAETAASIAVNAGAGALAYHFAAPGALNTVGVTELLVASTVAEVVSGYMTESWWKPMLH
jgi:hypothetical protein